MPNIEVHQYLTQQIGINPNRLSPSQDANALIRAAQNLNKKLSCALYNAVVKQDGDAVLTGPALTAQHLSALGKTATLAKNQPSCPENICEVIQDFEGAAYRYADFLSSGDDHALNVTNVINKQLNRAVEYGTHATPRHTLMRRGSEIYEVLTWMSTDEVTRMEGRFTNTQGLFSIQAERTRPKEWGDQNFTEYKITLGSGAFGAARVARQVSSDQYMVLKKVHPKDIGPKPEPTQVVRGVNDGSLPGVSRVYDSFMAHSTRGGGDIHVELSAYTLGEMGIIDTHKFISIFSMMAYAMNEKNHSEALSQLIRGQMIQGSSGLEVAHNAVRVATNPCSDPETVRRFRNTFAQQMLQAVQQMHSRDRAHNDVKPDNFVLAYDSNNLLRVKLIDFDLNASVKESVGQARDVYAAVFSAPQVSSSQVNNRADRNDAYSMGCTLRLLNGEPLEMLVLQRMLVKGEIRDSNNKMIKPVEDRRSIESRFSQLPELTTLSDIVDLLSHPHSGKRYTISQALESPLFTQSNNLLSHSQFSQMAEKIIRQGYMLPRETIDQLGVLQQCEQALAQESGASTSSPFGPMVTALRQQDRNLLVDRYKNTHGEKKLKAQLDKVQSRVASENTFAVLRRGVRQLNIGHHLKSPAEREASYVYKTPKK